MADERVDLQPLVTALDATSQFVLTQVVGGVRRVRQADAALLRGLDGKSSIATITNTSPPAIPAVGQNVTYAVDSSAGFVVDQIVSVASASTLKVVGTPTPTSIALLNVDAPVGAVATGARIVPSGTKGTPGTNGTNGTNGISAITTTSAFTQPAVNGSVTVTVASSAGFVNNQPVFHNIGGYYRVNGAPASATTIALINLGYVGNIAAAAAVAAGTLVPAGLKGIDGAGSGAGGIGLKRTFNTATTAQALDRELQLNNVTPSAATAIYIAELNQDDVDQSALLARVAANNLVQITDLSNSKFALYSLTTIVDSGGYRTLTVVFLEGTAVSGDFSGDVLFQWVPNNGGGGHIIQDETTDLTQRSKLSFVGTGVTATDDPTGDRTVVTIDSVSGGGGGLANLVITANQNALDGIAYICNSTTLIEVTAPATGSRFAVSTRGTGGFKIRTPAGVTLQLGTQIVNAPTKYIGNIDRFAYIEFFRLNDTWLAVSQANVQYGVDNISLTKVLIHFNEAVVSTPSDVVVPGRVIALSSGAAIAAGGKFGNGLNIATPNDFIEFSVSDPLGTNDFCLEWFAAPASNDVSNFMWLSFRRGNPGNFSQGSGPNVADASNGDFLVSTGTSVRILGTADIGNIYSLGGSATNGTTNYHWAIVRYGTTITFYRNGAVLSTSTFAAISPTIANAFNNNFGITPFIIRVGARSQYNDLALIGIRDELRLTIGDPVYTAAFTPPTAEFTYP